MDSKTVQRSALCRSRRELSNEYLLAKIGVDTAENEPLEVWGKLQFNIHHLPPNLGMALAWSFLAHLTHPAPLDVYTPCPQLALEVRQRIIKGFYSSSVFLHRLFARKQF